MARAFTDGGLTIREYRESDAPLISSAICESYEHLAPWMPWAKPNQTTAESVERIASIQERTQAGTDFTLGIFEGADFVGSTGFHPRLGTTAWRATEIGMWIRSSRAGQGMGVKSLRAMLAWAFSGEWEWERIVWRCEVTNIASARVAEKCGLRLEGIHLGESLNVHNQPCDIKWYALLRSEYVNQT